MHRFFCIIALAEMAYAQPAGMVGIWQGTLDAGVMKLRLAVHIAAGANGGYTSTLDSLDQNAMGIPIEETTISGNKVRLDMPALHAQFEGVLNAAGSEIAGTFTQGEALPLTLKHVDKVETPARPQEPKPPFPYEAVDVGYESGGVHLAGTLTMPRGQGPFPAALLISGSGPQDRDESLMGHKPFWVIADYLSRNGIAVLRVDDRGVGKSTGSSTGATLDDMAGDVLAGVSYLKGRKEIDGRHIGVIGHSEGGMVGPLAAARSAEIAFVVMLAGPGVSFQKAIDSGQSQAEAIMRQAGAPEDAIAWNNAMQNMMLRVLRADRDPKDALRDMQAELEKMKANLPEAQRAAMDAPQAAAQAKQQFEASVTPEMRTILLFDPAEVLRKVQAPVLALNGSRDMQVLAKANLPGIVAALAEGGNSDYTVAELPGLNHLFQSCKACTLGEYAQIEETFSPLALATVRDWLLRHTRAAEQ